MARFFRRGVTKAYFLTGVDSYSPGSGVGTATPTNGEFNASGTALHPQLAAISGFMLQNNPITTPDLETTFDSQIGGPDSAANSSMDFYSARMTDASTGDGNTSAAGIRSKFSKGTSGFIVLAPYGTVSGVRCEVWPVQVTSISDEYSLGNDAAKYKVEFSVTSIPAIASTVPGGVSV